MKKFRTILVVFHLVAACIFFTYGVNIGPGNQDVDWFALALYILAGCMIGIASCVAAGNWCATLFAVISIIVGTPVILLTAACLYYFPGWFNLLFLGLALLFFFMEISVIIITISRDRQTPEADSEGPI